MPTPCKPAARRRTFANGQKRVIQPKLGHDSVSERPLATIRPAPENDKIYRPISPSDPAIKSLAASIKKYGLMEPLVISGDGYILSGHRRYVACRLAGLTMVRCRVDPVLRSDIDAFMVRLREYNRQREKSLDEKLRENIVSADPAEAYESLIAHRQERAVILEPAMSIDGTKKRCKISEAKAPFLAAIASIIEASKEFWPLSDRRIHYKLLDNPPLRHASKPDSTYENTPESYKSLVELLTRARLTGLIPMAAIADETRPVCVWNVHREAGTFVEAQLDGFLKGYWRDLMQSQPCHLEIIGEKNTVAPTLRPVAAEYCIPLTTGRGYCSLPPRFDMAKRYRASGKDKLVLLMLSDFDPDGEEIAHSFARSMRDDFGIKNIHPIKVALTGDQVQARNLPPVMTAKESSVHHAKFTAKHGHHVFELDALEPSDLQDILREAIDATIDIDAFNAELDAEKEDALFLETARTTLSESLASIDWRRDGAQ